MKKKARRKLTVHDFAEAWTQLAAGVGSQVGEYSKVFWPLVRSRSAEFSIRLGQEQHKIMMDRCSTNESLHFIRWTRLVTNVTNIDVYEVVLRRYKAVPKGWAPELHKAIYMAACAMHNRSIGYAPTFGTGTQYSTATASKELTIRTGDMGSMYARMWPNTPWADFAEESDHLLCCDGAGRTPTRAARVFYHHLHKIDMLNWEVLRGKRMRAKLGHL